MKVKRVRVRVFRGGAWNLIARDARCAYRDWYNPGNRYYSLGFRCCFSPSFVIKNES